jgi:hypothetical protein
MLKKVPGHEYFALSTVLLVYATHYKKRIYRTGFTAENSQHLLIYLCELFFFSLKDHMKQIFFWITASATV